MGQARKDSNIVLVGMPGAGKSTLGVVLAKMIGYDFLDTDLLIQRTHGCTLQEIIDNCGREYFIEAEGRVLSAVECSETVIATGGSAVYSEEAMRHLSSMGTVVYLQVSLDEVARRLGSFESRGVVARSESVSSLADLYAERVGLYERCADIIFSTEGLSLESAASSLASLVQTP